VKFAPARLFSVCRAIELALKAYLSIHGYFLEKLSNQPLAHSLSELLQAALKCGLLSDIHLDETQISEIERASPYYSEKVFEYPAIFEAVRGYPQCPDLNILLAAADALVTNLGTPCLEAS
jgi:hypothetical protein